MRKFLAVLTATVLVLSLAACGAPKETEASVSGKIVTASMNTIDILTDAGEVLTFATVDADTTKCNGLLTDSTVTIFYTGKVSGTDTSGAVVTRMEQPAA